MTIERQLFQAARKGDVETLAALLDAHPDKLLAREQPYEWTAGDPSDSRDARGSALRTGSVQAGAR